jgi:hypothetical protein
MKRFFINVVSSGKVEGVGNMWVRRRKRERRDRQGIKKATNRPGKREVEKIQTTVDNVMKQFCAFKPTVLTGIFL